LLRDGIHAPRSHSLPSQACMDNPQGSQATLCTTSRCLMSHNCWMNIVAAGNLKHRKASDFAPSTTLHLNALVKVLAQEHVNFAKIEAARERRHAPSRGPPPALAPRAQFDAGDRFSAQFTRPATHGGAQPFWHCWLLVHGKASCMQTRMLSTAPGCTPRSAVREGSRCGTRPMVRLCHGTRPMARPRRRRARSAVRPQGSRPAVREWSPG